MPSLSEFRKKYPQYDSVDDKELLDALHDKYYSNIPIDDFYKKMEFNPDEEKGNYVLGALQRGAGNVVSGIGDIVGDLPEIIGNLPSSNPISDLIMRESNKLIAPAYQKAVEPVAESIRGTGQDIVKSAGTGHYGSVFDSKNIGEAAGSIGETLLESAIPTAGAALTGALTKSPAAAGAVLLGTGVPATYGEIRGTQRAEGKEDIGSAVKGTILSSALDYAFGSGSAARKLGSEAAVAMAKKAAEKALVRVPKEMLKIGGQELVTEMAQTAIERTAGGADVLSEDGIKDIVESGIVGFFGGAVTGGGTEIGNRILPGGNIDENVQEQQSTESETPPTPQNKYQAPEGFAPEDIHKRLAGAVGDNIEDHKVSAAVLAMERRLNNDLAFGDVKPAADYIVERGEYLNSLTDDDNAGTLEARKNILAEARNILKDFRGNTAPEFANVDRLDAFAKANELYPNDDSLATAYYQGATGAKLDMPDSNLSEADLQSAYDEGKAYATENPKQEQQVQAQPKSEFEQVPDVKNLEGTYRQFPLSEDPQLKVRGTPMEPAPLQIEANTMYRRFIDNFTRKMNYAFQQAHTHDIELAEKIGVESLPIDLSLEKPFKSLNARRQGGAYILINRYFKPIEKEILRLKVNPQDLNQYLIAKTTPYRNARVAKRNADYPQGGSSMLDSDAANIIENFRAEGKLNNLEAVAKRAYKLKDRMIDDAVQNDMMTPEQAKNLREAEPFWMPLRGFAADGDLLLPEETRDDLHGGFGAVGSGVSGRDFRTPMGRTSQPFNPLHTLFEDALRMNARGQLQANGKTLIRLAEAYPDMYKDVISIYDDKAGPGKKKKFYNRPSPDEEGGVTKPIVDMKNEVRANKDKYLVVRQNGQNKYIEFQNTSGGRALQRLFANTRPKQVGPILRAWGNFGTVLKSFLTYRNPTYQLITAPVRDIAESLATAITNANTKGSPAFKKRIAAKAAGYVSNFKGPIWNSVSRYAFGFEPANEVQAGYFKDIDNMIVSGGAPMHALWEDASTMTNKFMNDIKRIEQMQKGNPLAASVEGLRLIDKGMEHTAETMDLVARLATYKAAIDEGLSTQDAAELSLDSSLDLTRRGEWSHVMDRAVPFFSASMEGSRKVLRWMRNPASRRKVLYSLIAAGMAESFINNLTSGDEDDDGRPDYMDVHESLRQSRIIIHYGPGDKYIKLVPFGQQLGFFKYIGNILMDTMLGNSSPENASASIMGAATDAVDGLIAMLSPARVYGGDVATVVTSMMPLQFKPILEAENNVNFFGSPIYDQSFGNEPRSRLGRDTTADAWKEIAKFLNDITGGTEIKSGFIDRQPEYYRHIVSSWLGGTYQLMKQGTNLATGSAKGDISQKLPLVQGFVGKGFDYVPQSKYFRYTANMKRFARARDNMPEEKWIKEQAKDPINTNDDLLDLYKEIEKERKKLIKERNELLDDTKDKYSRDKIMEVYQEDLNRLYTGFNRYYQDFARNQ